MICHLLLEADPVLAEARRKRGDSIKAVLEALGYTVKTYGDQRCSVSYSDPEMAENLETQHGVTRGAQEVFALKLFNDLKNVVKPNEIVVATEAWHVRCFRGMITATKGLVNGSPVIEYGIDYSESWAPWRVFFSRFAAANASLDASWNPNWIHATPFIPKQELNYFSLPVYDRDSNACSIDHLWAMAEGIPTVAPDFGTWAETVVQGLNGYLYRTEVGRKEAEESATKLPTEAIRNWVTERYTLNRAVAWSKGFFAQWPSA